MGLEENHMSPFQFRVSILLPILRQTCHFWAQATGNPGLIFSYTSLQPPLLRGNCLFSFLEWETRGEKGQKVISNTCKLFYDLVTRKVLGHRPSASVDIFPVMFALTFVLSSLAFRNASGAIPYPQSSGRGSAGFPSPPERQPASPKSQKQTVKIGKRTGALFIYLSVCCMSMYAMVYVHVRSGDMHMCTHGCLPQLLFSSYLECSLIGKIGWLVRPRDPSIFAPWMLGLQVYVTTSGFLHGHRGSSLSSWGKHWLNQLCSCPRPLLLHVFAFNFPGEVDEWCTRRDPLATKWLCLS